MKLGGRIDISIVFLCIVRILSLLLMILHDSYFVQVTVTKATAWAPVPLSLVLRTMAARLQKGNLPSSMTIFRSEGPNLTMTESVLPYYFSIVNVTVR